MNFRSPLLLLLTLLSAAAARGGGGGGSDDLVAELAALQSRSPSGVIHLDDRTISRFLTYSPTPRPYSLLIFFDAASLRDRSDLHLPQLRSEFALVSAALSSHHASTPSASKLFFCDIEFQESQSSFNQFGVSSLPHLRYVGPDVATLSSSEAMDKAGFSRLADSMAEFVEAKTNLPVGPIIRPPPVSTKQIVFILILLLISAPFVIKKVIAGETLLSDARLWAGLAVSVYFFSVSGSMHNIIRKMPMFLLDREDPSKMIFFYQGSGMQLGAEGFAVGFLYTIVGLMLAFMTHALVYIKSLNVQRGFMLVGIAVSYWAVSKVIQLNNWKTGYSIHAFWPSSW